MARWWRAAGAEQDTDPEWVELAPQSWDAHDSTYAATSFLAVARRIPALVREALRVAWRASRPATIAAVGLQVAAGLLTGVGLLATKGVLQALFAGGPTPDRVRAAVPSLALVVAARRPGLGWRLPPGGRRQGCRRWWTWRRSAGCSS